MSPRPGIRPCLRRSAPSALPLVRLAVDRRLDVLETMRDAGQALGMADKQVTARLQPIGELADDALLGRAVEVNHHVAAENHRKRSRPSGRLEQIYGGEGSPGGEGR